MKRIIWMHLICNDCKGTQRTEICNPTVLADGTVDGYVGSAGNYCDACDSTNLTVLGATEEKISA